MDPVPKTTLSFVDNLLTAYCESSTTDEPPICRTIREEAESHAKAHWISGPLVGALLQLLISIRQSKRILDIGTFLGYSAAYMAAAHAEAMVTSLERDPELAFRAKSIISLSPLSGRVHVENIDAETWFETNPGVAFDFIFFDSDRTHLLHLQDRLLNAVKAGGVLVMDNACLRRKVLTPDRPWELETAGFNRALQQNKSFLTVLLPIRDGVLIAYKRPKP